MREEECADLWVLKLIVPALLREGLRVLDAIGVEHSIKIYIHEVVEVLHHAHKPSSSRIAACVDQQMTGLGEPNRALYI